MFSARSQMIFAPVLFCAAISTHQEQTELIRVTTNHVILDVRVVNSKTGQAIPRLSTEDFEVYEDGVRQEITHFSHDSLPISAALLLDVSGSMQPAIGELRRDALRALQHLKPEDEVALIAYGGVAQLVQDFTTDRNLLVDKIGGVNNYYIGTRSTSLPEAVFQAAVHMERAANPASRRIIIAVTDDVSLDDDRVHNKQQALQQLLESAASLYGITVLSAAKVFHEELLRRQAERQAEMTGGGYGGLRPGARLGDARPPTSSYTGLKDFSEPTGGAIFTARIGVVAAKLGDLVDGIRECYSFGYTPSNLKMDGRLREFTVKLRRKIVDESTGNEIKPAVIVRKGYYPSRLRPNSEDNPVGPVSLPPLLIGDPESKMARALYVATEMDDFRTAITPSLFRDSNEKGLVRVSLSIDTAGTRPNKPAVRYTATLKLFAAVFNQTGMMMSTYGNNYRLTFNDASSGTLRSVGEMTFALPPGRYLIRTVLRDMSTGKMSSRHTPIEVTPASKGVP